MGMDDLINERPGFTLIELIMAIIILAILSLLAVAKYQEFNTKTQSAALASVAASLTAGTAVNYAAKQTGASYKPVTTCAETALTLQGGVLPKGFSFPSSGSGNGSTFTPDGKSVSCVVQGPAPSTNTATFNALGAS